jgi:hypothetical protein
VIGGTAIAFDMRVDFSTIEYMPAVVLRGPANSAPEVIFGPFPSMNQAEEWALAHPRDGGYCIAEALMDPAEVL